MRIVGGEWRGRVIKAPSGAAVRPTLDRVREAWMSILMPHLPGARVVDLFAGSGALGIEALSRGASSADFVDTSARSLEYVRGNLAAFGAMGSARIIKRDALKFAAAAADTPYDIAFADPPYMSGAAPVLAELWLEGPFAAVLSVEHPRTVAMPEGGDTRRYGDTCITFYR